LAGDDDDDGNDEEGLPRDDDTLAGDVLVGNDDGDDDLADDNDDDDIAGDDLAENDDCTGGDGLAGLCLDGCPACWPVQDSLCYKIGRNVKTWSGEKKIPKSDTCTRFFRLGLPPMIRNC